MNKKAWVEEDLIYAAYVRSGSNYQPNRHMPDDTEANEMAYVVLACTRGVPRPRGVRPDCQMQRDSLWFRPAFHLSEAWALSGGCLSRPQLYAFMVHRVSEINEQTPERNLACRVFDAFHSFAKKTSAILGAPWSFVIALSVILAWGITGPIFHYSDTWQLVINTGTTIVTFLMVFLLQNTQNRDTKNTQLKLDEIIRALRGARNDMLDLDRLSEDELTRLENEFQALSDRASSERDARKTKAARSSQK